MSDLSWFKDILIYINTYLAFSGPVFNDTKLKLKVSLKASLALKPISLREKRIPNTLIHWFWVDHIFNKALSLHLMYESHQKT